MREIKFKFLLENGEVTKSYYLKELIDSDSYINIECEYSSKIKQELQYTGLKDKNNVEIYESDIVKNNQGKISQINFIEDYAKYEAFDEDFSWVVSDTFEVIGNIHENPELLN